MAPFGVTSSQLRARGLVVFLQMMALLVCVVIMSSSYTCHGAGRSLMLVREEKVVHFEHPEECFVPPCH
ncbi:unnamed protein product [Alopecurus aequalis]